MKKSDVSTPSPRVEYLEQQRQLVRTIMGGTFVGEGDDGYFEPCQCKACTLAR